jgi:hypothetical protein
MSASPAEPAVIRSVAPGHRSVRQLRYAAVFVLVDHDIGDACLSAAGEYLGDISNAGRHQLPEGFWRELESLPHRSPWALQHETQRLAHAL